MSKRPPDLATARAPEDQAFVPQPILTIGVTGHRLARLAGADLASVKQAVAATLDTIAAALPHHAAPIDIRFITALADGGDTIIAEQVVTRGWSLMSVLPFARASYRADFAGADAIATYERLLVASDAVFELPGDYTPDTFAAAYERAGRVILSQCDVLLALWDHGPVQGRGGTAQIVAEAVMLDIPVIQIDPLARTVPTLHWDGLTAHDLGQQTIETVPNASLDALPALLQQLLNPPMDDDSQRMIAQFETAVQPKRNIAIAYPLLLALMGVQRLRRGHVNPPDAAVAGSIVQRSCARVLARTGAFGAQLERLLLPRFARADVRSSYMAQVFRSSYVANFILSACAVLLTLLSLALPITAKPVLVMAELLTIGTVLALTTTGNARGWHRRWLDNRNLAECLRCLALSAQIGLLNLHGGGSTSESPAWVRYYRRATAQELGLPHVAVDDAYLHDVRSGLCDLIDAQTAYLSAEDRRMHHLEHRLHRLGTALFALTALVCIASLAFEAVMTMLHTELSEQAMHVFLVSVTMATAGLPALGAAIYGIRMQGEFAAVAERAHGLGAQLATLRAIVAEDEQSFDTLKRRIIHLTDLLTSDLAQWQQTYRARPLALPG